MMKKPSAYSLLVKHNFKLMDNIYPSSERIIWYRGYICAYLKFGMTDEDRTELNRILAIYTDEQWNKLILRLYKNGHVE